MNLDQNPSLDFSKLIIRWGKIFETDALYQNKYLYQSQNIQSVNYVTFYLMFTLERLLLLRWLLYNFRGEEYS